MNVPFSPPDMSQREIDEVVDTLRSGWITTGPKTKRFESEIAAFCGAPKTACLNSATAAMELALRILGVGEGDEVITCAYTYTASASVSVHVGARPVLVDSVNGGVATSADAVYDAITENTKAIIPIDIGGIPADYNGIKKAIEAKKTLFRPRSTLQEQLGRVAIVGDCAHSFGANYNGQSVAKASDIGCFSFHAVKNLTTAEGGAAVFGDIGAVSAADIYRDFMLLSLHGQSKDALSKEKLGGWEYDIVMPGYKCNMTDILASLGLAQLDRYAELKTRRAEIVARYDRHFEGTRIHPLRHKGDGFESSYHLYIAHIDGADEQTRNEIVVKMAEQGVVTNVHYKPLPMFTAYKNLGWNIADFPNAYGYYQGEITLPLHTLLTDEQVDFVAATLKDIVAAC